MTARRLTLLAALVGLAVPGPAWGQTDLTRIALLSGRYDDVINTVDAMLRRGVAGPEDVRQLLVALSRRGEYERAIEVGGDYAATAGPAAAEVATRLGEALYARGELAAAEARFREAVAGGAGDELTALLDLGVLEYERGDRDAAMDRFRAVTDAYNRGTTRSQEDLVAVARACTYLGVEDPAWFHDAVRAFDQAIELDVNNPAPSVLLGELFLQKYDSQEAAGLIEMALRLDPNWARAHLAEARRLVFEGSPDALARVDRALELNPNLVAAHVLRARMLLTAENRVEAQRASERALEVNPVSVEAMAMLAATRYLDMDTAGFVEVETRARNRNPRSAHLHETVADMAAQHRRYSAAVDLATAAVEADPQSWSAWGVLGLDQLRTGAIEAGRASLTRAFEGDPFNVWFKNTLDLLDTLPRYRTTSTEHFELVIREDRSELVAPYIGDLAEEAWRTLSDKYGYEPPAPVRLEVYERPADFSVRTIGLAGMGALGVAFGPVVAVVGGGAPGMGEFNWGATVWHEIGHVVTLGASDFRVPRWVSEGLSVYEERRARPGWGEDVDPGFLTAYLRGNLLPVSRIGEGFFRPRYPQHLGHSYVQASLVCELIEERYGFDALPSILRAYGTGASTAEAFEKVLGTTLSDFDAMFDDYLRMRYAGPMAALSAAVTADEDEQSAPGDFNALRALADQDDDNFVAQLRTGAALAESDQLDAAEPYLRRAKRLFPTYSGSDSPYLYLARVLVERGEIGPAIGELTTLLEMSDKHLQARLWLARLFEETGDVSGAAATLETTLYIDVNQPEVLARTAALHEQVGNWNALVRARKALLALGPVDRAGALYELARAQVYAGDSAAARRSVLGALEIAPSFADAQQLLLDLRARREDS